MLLKEAIELLKKNNGSGWIAKTKAPHNRITADDLLGEWYHAEIANAVIGSNDQLEFEERRTTCPKILPATHYRVIGFGEDAANG